MTWQQLALLGLAILGTLWQVIKVVQINALVNRHGTLRVRFDFYVVLALTIAAQVAFIASVTR